MLEELLQLLELVNNNYLSIEIFRKIYKIYIKNNKLSLALEFINQAIDIYNDIEEYEIKSYIFYKLLDLNKIIIFLKSNKNVPFYLTYNYFEKLNSYCSLVDDIPVNILFNPKKEYRYFCYNCLNLISNKEYPKLELDLLLETVLIEFRPLPHLEFLIKNMILKLGNNWSHTIVCGNLNYKYIFNICSKFNIKVIKLNTDNLEVSDYNKLLTSIDFWNLFKGNKILIYQEDTFIFKSNINDFLEWDYIGAPFPKDHNINKSHVGNGGLSLRTKKCMIEILEKCPKITDKEAEDVYFSTNMINYNIGNLATFIPALKFSSEFFINSNSFGGHCFFYYNYKWKNLILQNL